MLNTAASLTCFDLGTHFIFVWKPLHTKYIDLISRGRENTGDYFTSRGQYDEENNQAGIFEAEGNKSLIPGRLARSPPSLYSKRAKRKLCVCA